MILYRTVKVTYSKSISDFLRRKHRQLLNSKNAIFKTQCLTDILFIMQPHFLWLAVAPFIMRNSL